MSGKKVIPFFLVEGDLAVTFTGTFNACRAIMELATLQKKNEVNRNRTLLSELYIVSAKYQAPCKEVMIR